MSVEDDGIGVLCGSFILLLLSAQDVYDVEIGVVDQISLWMCLV